jgi:thiol:disulfide interchange protein DsbD
LAVLLACTSFVGAQSSPASHGKVDLVAQDSTLEANRVAWVGVLFDLEKGWHIYWVNPGDAGEPPRIQWDLPTGFRADGIRWPTPVRLIMGTLVDYGYEGRTLLPVPLQVPASYQPGARVTLTADVRYFVCREVCVPARARLSLSLPSGTSTPADLAARQELFRRAQEGSPKPMPATWKVQATESKNQFVLTVQTGSPETKAVFFPLERDQVDNAASQIVVPTARDGLRMTLKKSELLEKSPSVLKGVVVFGPDRAFEVAAPVSPRR